VGTAVASSWKLATSQCRDLWRIQRAAQLSLLLVAGYTLMGSRRVSDSNDGHDCAPKPLRVGLLEQLSGGTILRREGAKRSFRLSHARGKIPIVWRIALKLPNAERAVVEIAKLRDYCLSTTHEVGKHKARDLVGPLGVAVIRSAWIVLAGEDFARLTTCYVL